MQIDFVQVLITVLSLILLLVPGFIMAKMKMFSEKATQTLSTLVLYCCQTALIFMCFQGKNFDSSIGINMLIVAGLTFAVHFIMILIVSLCVKGNQELKLRCVRYASVFGNCGYIGVPLLEMLFSGNAEVKSEILIYTAVILSVWNILNWTFGVYMMTKDKKQVSFKKILLNPVIIAVILGLICFLAFQKPIKDLAPAGSVGDSILTKLMDSIDMFGKAVTPLSMTVVGIRLANVKFKQLFLDKLAYFQCGLKLIVMSLVSMLLVAFLPIDTTVKYAVFFCMSMPAASATTMFAVKFNGDGDFASICVLLSTILSIATMPLMFLLFSGGFGVVI